MVPWFSWTEIVKDGIGQIENKKKINKEDDIDDLP